MKVKFLVVGKTSFDYLKIGEEIYQERIKHYCSFERIEVQDVKNSKSLSKDEIKRKEAQAILSKLSSTDFLVLLDEKGKELSSLELSKWIEKRNLFPHSIAFLIGGAYGFDESIYARMNMKLALSKMTFSHQMVRLIFLEQLYRAFSILKGEPYHH